MYYNELILSHNTNVLIHVEQRTIRLQTTTEIHQPTLQRGRQLGNGTVQVRPDQIERMSDAGIKGLGYVPDDVRHD